MLGLPRPTEMTVESLVCTVEIFADVRKAQTDFLGTPVTFNQK